jgi:hypothetical protein
MVQAAFLEHSLGRAFGQRTCRTALDSERTAAAAAKIRQDKKLRGAPTGSPLSTPVQAISHALRCKPWSAPAR